MPDKKLTDKEIVKCLELLLDKIRAYECENIFINEASILDILNLINRLQAENERLKIVENGFIELQKLYRTAKTEAYKEFAERLKKQQYLSIVNMVVSTKDIDNLLKELVGEDNEMQN